MEYREFKIFGDDLLAYLQANATGFTFNSQSIQKLKGTQNADIPIMYEITGTAPAGDNWGINPRTTDSVELVKNATAEFSSTTTHGPENSDELYDDSVNFVTNNVRPFQFVSIDEEESQVLKVIDEHTLLLSRHNLATEEGVDYNVYDYMVQKNYTKPEIVMVLISLFHKSREKVEDLKQHVSDFLTLWDEEKLITVGDTTTESLASTGMRVLSEPSWTEADFQDDKKRWYRRRNGVVTFFSNRMVSKLVAPIQIAEIDMEPAMFTGPNPNYIEEIDLRIFNTFMEV